MKSSFLLSRKGRFLSRTSLNTSSRPILPKKKKIKKFDQNKSLFSFLRCCYGVESLVLFSQNVTKHFFSSHVPQKERMKKFYVLNQNHGLPLLAKCKFCNFLKWMLFKSRNASIAYYLEGHQTVFVALFCLKRNDEEIYHF